MNPKYKYKEKAQASRNRRIPKMFSPPILPLANGLRPARPRAKHRHQRYLQEERLARRAEPLGSKSIWNRRERSQSFSKRAGVWWSSRARTVLVSSETWGDHTCLLTCAVPESILKPWRQRHGLWRPRSRITSPDGTTASQFRRHERTGRQPGGDSFIEKLDRLLGGPLKPGKPGQYGPKRTIKHGVPEFPGDMNVP